MDLEDQMPYEVAMLLLVMFGAGHALLALLNEVFWDFFNWCLELLLKIREW